MCDAVSAQMTIELFSNVYVSRMCDAMSALDCIIYLFIYFKCMYNQAQNVQTNLSVRRPARVPYLVCVAPPHSLTDVQWPEIWPSGWLSCKSRDLQVCWDGYHPMSIALADFARNPLSHNILCNAQTGKNSSPYYWHEKVAHGTAGVWCPAVLQSDQ